MSLAVQLLLLLAFYAFGDVGGRKPVGAPDEMCYTGRGHHDD